MHVECPVAGPWARACVGSVPSVLNPTVQGDARCGCTRMARRASQGAALVERTCLCTSHAAHCRHLYRYFFALCAITPCAYRYATYSCKRCQTRGTVHGLPPPFSRNAVARLVNDIWTAERHRHISVRRLHATAGPPSSPVSALVS